MKFDLRSLQLGEETFFALEPRCLMCSPTGLRATCFADLVFHHKGQRVLLVRNAHIGSLARDFMFAVLYPPELVGIGEQGIGVRWRRILASVDAGPEGPQSVPEELRDALLWSTPSCEPHAAWLYKENGEIILEVGESALVESAERSSGEEPLQRIIYRGVLAPGTLKLWQDVVVAWYDSLAREILPPFMQNCSMKARAARGVLRRAHRRLQSAS